LPRELLQPEHPTLVLMVRRERYARQRPACQYQPQVTRQAAVVAA